MATLFAPATASVHVHAARRLHFSASSDGLLYWLSEECWGLGLVRLGELLDDLLIEGRLSSQSQPWIPSWKACCPSEAWGAAAPFSRQAGCSTGVIGSRVWVVLVPAIWES